MSEEKISELRITTLDPCGWIPRDQTDIAHVVVVLAEVLIEFGIDLGHTVLHHRRNKEEDNDGCKDSECSTDVKRARVMNIFQSGGVQIILDVGVSVRPDKSANCNEDG